MHTLRSYTWSVEKVAGAIVATMNTAPAVATANEHTQTAEVYVVMLAQSLLVCWSAEPEPSSRLDACEFLRSDGNQWNVREATHLLASLRPDDVHYTVVPFAEVLPRLPNMQSIATASAVLSLVRGAASDMCAWKLTSQHITRIPRKMAVNDETELREMVKEQMHHKKISQGRYAKQAGLSIATFADFCRNTKDSRGATLSKIRMAYESFQRN